MQTSSLRDLHVGKECYLRSRQQFSDIVQKAGNYSENRMEIKGLWSISLFDSRYDGKNWA